MNGKNMCNDLKILGLNDLYGIREKINILHKNHSTMQSSDSYFEMNVTAINFEIHSIIVTLNDLINVLDVDDRSTRDNFMWLMEFQARLQFFPQRETEYMKLIQATEDCRKEYLISIIPNIATLANIVRTIYNEQAKIHLPKYPNIKLV